MVESDEQKRSPVIRKKMAANSQNMASLISPRFKSAAAMAGWDEEALLLATLIVEDTPDRDRDSKQKGRFVLNSKSPLSNSSRKRRARNPPQPIVLDLDEGETPKKDSGKKKKEKKNCVNEGSKVGEKELTLKGSDVNSTDSSAALPCMDKLREELSCAICLEICFEPSTTPCGHSFCRKCLRSAADKCGKKCPKCRQLISNGRSCTVNTVLWNTIQLLFPQEIEARKVATSTLNIREAAAQNPIPETAFYNNRRNRSIQPYPSSRGMNSRRNEAIVLDDENAELARRLQRELDGQNNSHRTSTTTRVHGGNSRNQTSSSSISVRGRTRRGVSSQDEDAAFALRLQREEFMQAFTSRSQAQSSSSNLLARANLRAMATRAMDLRIRDRRM